MNYCKDCEYKKIYFKDTTAVLLKLIINFLKIKKLYQKFSKCINND